MTDSVRSIDTENLKDSAARAAATLSDTAAKAAKDAAVLAEQAREAAVHAKAWAEPHARDLVTRLRPRAEKAWHDGVQVAAPRVGRLAEKAGPLVDTAHDKLVPLIDTAHEKFVPMVDAAHVRAGHAVDIAHDKLKDDYLPRLVAALNDAAAKASGEPLEIVAPKKKRKGFLWLLITGAAAAVGYVFWRRAQPQNDPWAEPWEQTTTPDYEGVARDARVKAGDAAEAVGTAAGVAVARSREAGEKITERAAGVREDIAERAAEMREELSERAAGVQEKLTDAVEEAKERAAEVTKKATSRSRTRSRAEEAGAAGVAAGETDSSTDATAETTDGLGDTAGDTVEDLPRSSTGETASDEGKNDPFKNV